MISLLIFVISFVWLAGILLQPYLFLAKKAIGNISPQIKPASLPTGAVDEGFWGTVRIFWKICPAFWDGTPTYVVARGILGYYKTSMARLFYLTNWKSAGRVVLCSDLKTMREVFCSYTWINHLDDGNYLYNGSFGKPLGLIFSNGGYWKAARKAAAKALRDCRLTDASHVAEFFSDEIANVLADLRQRLENRTTAVFSPNHVIDPAQINGAFKMLFGRRPFKDDPRESRLAELLASGNENFGLGLCAADVFPFFKYFLRLLPSGRKHVNLCNTIYEIVAKEAERRKKSNSKNQLDFMTTFLVEVQANEGTNPNYFTFENLQATIRDLMLGGTSSTYGSLVCI